MTRHFGSGDPKVFHQLACQLRSYRRRPATAAPASEFCKRYTAFLARPGDDSLNATTFEFVYLVNNVPSYKQIAYVLVRRTGYRLKDMANYLGRDPATLATLLARMNEDITIDSQETREIERLVKIVEK